MRREETESGMLTGISSFLAGTMVGAIVAILLAPGSGEETRERIGGWMQDKGERGRDVVNRLRERIPGRARERAQSMGDYGGGSTRGV